jgi:hypothetical protein
MIKKRSRAYKSWWGIKERCYNRNATKFYNYGGRGIKVCDRWLEAFENFYKDMGEGPKGLSIDRIDNNGDYCPENCRWATIAEQNSNKRNNVFFTINGKQFTLSQTSRMVGISNQTIRKRLKLGWSIACALLIPINIHINKNDKRGITAVAKHKRILNALKY